MNKNIFFIGILILLEACSVSNNKDFYYPKKKVSHTKSDYPISQSLFKSNQID